MNQNNLTFNVFTNVNFTVAGWNGFVLNSTASIPACDCSSWKLELLFPAEPHAVPENRYSINENTGTHDPDDVGRVNALSDLCSEKKSDWIISCILKYRAPA